MKNTWCRICGKEYTVCPVCESTRTRTPWRIITDTAAHYKIWLAVSQYKSGVIDKSTAKEILDNVKLSKNELETFIPAVQEIINAINQPDDPVPSTDLSSSEDSNNIPTTVKKQRRRGRTK